MQSVSDSVAKMSKAKFLIALNETDLLMLLLSLSSVKSTFNASSTSSVITLSRLLIKIADQKSRGYGPEKKLKGRDRHIVVDTMGLMITSDVRSASVQDRDGDLNLFT